MGEKRENEGLENVTFYTYQELANDMNEFLKYYTIEKIWLMPSEARRKFPKQRVCRFCKKSGNETTFKKDAHTIPHSLGNKFDVSDFECDACNEKFSRYESALAGYLGVTRTVFGSVGKKKIPKYKSRGKSLIAESMDARNLENAILISDESGKNITIAPQTGDATISYEKNGYVPILVYKALLKMALSIIDAKDVESYNHAYQFLTNDYLNQSYSQVSLIHVTNLSEDYQLHGYLMRKSDLLSRVPTHVFNLYFRRMIFQIFLPYNIYDGKVYDGNQLDLKFSPPIFFKKPKDVKKNYEATLQDFSGLEKVYETGYMKMSFDPGQLSNLTAIDSVTGQEKKDHEFNAKGVAKIILVPIDHSLDISELKNIDFSS